MPMFAPWSVTSCGLYVATNVSKEHMPTTSALKMKAVSSSKQLIFAYKSA